MLFNEGFYRFTACRTCGSIEQSHTPPVVIRIERFLPFVSKFHHQNSKAKRLLFGSFYFLYYYFNHGKRVNLQLEIELESSVLSLSLSLSLIAIQLLSRGFQILIKWLSICKIIFIIFSLKKCHIISHVNKHH